MPDMSRDELISSLRDFKARRDALLHEDQSEFEHHLQRFVSFCEVDPLVQQVLKMLPDNPNTNSETWWARLSEEGIRGIEAVRFPDDKNEDLALRFAIMKDVAAKRHSVWGFGSAIRFFKTQEAPSRFLSLVVRPFCEELSNRLEQAAMLASAEARALQAVPLSRIPSDNEVKIFLSHKSADKPLVSRYFRSLSLIGFSPWLDEPEMPAGTKLERGLLDGFEKSCAAVFFITENFVDEGYLASEVDYAIRQKRKKGERFAIITLVFGETAQVPGLLQDYVFVSVSNDLDGFYEIVRALPIELGPVRWKESVVRST